MDDEQSASSVKPSAAGTWLAVVIAALAAFFLWRGLPSVVDNVRARFWPRTTASIASVAEVDDTVIMPARRGGITTTMAVPHLHILYAFWVDDKSFTGLLSTSTSEHNRELFKAGGSLTVHYDRADPRQNTASLSVPVASWFSVGLGVVLVSVAFGLWWFRPEAVLDPASAA